MIEGRDVSVAIGGRRIVGSVSLAAPAGAITAIVGPNGSGKTTLLRALSGELPFAGTVTVNGSPLGALKPWQLAGLRAVLPQVAALSFPFTVREVVALGLSAGVARTQPELAPTLPERALERVDLAGFAGRYYGQLSGGEQQRVQLARVLCQVWHPVLDGVPRFLLLDEPVSSLDIRHQLLVMDIARDFADAGGGVVAVLHDLNLAALYADRLCMMRDGRVAALGPPREVVTDAALSAVFGCPLKVGAVPEPCVPFVLPQSVRERAPARAAEDPAGASAGQL